MDAIKVLEDAKFRTPLKLRPGKRGQWTLEVKKIAGGFKMPLVSVRTAMLTDRPMLYVDLTGDVTVHSLKHSGRLITSDTPEEVYSQSQAFEAAHGRVVVGGLGIGMAAVMLTEIPEVTEVVVVELEQDVVALVEKRLPRTRVPIRVVQADLFDYLRDCPIFDFSYFDIWTGTGEGSWLEYVVPLRRLVRKHHGVKPVTCWMEEEMKGQVRQAMLAMLTPVPGTDPTQWRKRYQPAWVFHEAVKDVKETAERMRLLDLYLDAVGSREWERTFPWDAFKKEVAADSSIAR